MKSTRLAIAAFAILMPALSSYSAENDRAEIKAEVAKRHDESVKRLADWIKQVSIAAEDRGFPEGAEHMAQQAREAGFQRVEIVPTKESRACLQRSMPVRQRQWGSISCMT